MTLGVEAADGAGPPFGDPFGVEVADEAGPPFGDPFAVARFHAGQVAHVRAAIAAGDDTEARRLQLDYFAECWRWAARCCQRDRRESS